MRYKRGSVLPTSVIDNHKPVIDCSKYDSVSVDEDKEIGTYVVNVCIVY